MKYNQYSEQGSDPRHLGEGLLYNSFYFKINVFVETALLALC